MAFSVKTLKSKMNFFVEKKKFKVYEALAIGGRDTNVRDSKSKVRYMYKKTPFRVHD